MTSDPITNIVVLIFHTPGVALALAGLLLLFAIGLIAWTSYSEYRPLLFELRERWNLLATVRSGKARHNFYKQFDAVNARFAVFAAGGTASANLILGWSDFRSLLVETDEQFATTARADDLFKRLDEPARTLEWWANILVAIGLTFTFLGIVAALSEATVAVSDSAGADSAAMGKALMALLAIASTKFWTSIAGVLGSIILRVVARLRRKQIESAQAQVFESLDACVKFMPPEKVMVDQLDALERIEGLLAKSAGLA